MRGFLLRRGFILPVTVVGVVPLGIAIATRAWLTTGVAFACFGALSFVVGLSLLIATTRLFDSNGGSLAPWNPPKSIVIVGPYRWVRNPMILGIFMMLSGEAAALHSEIIAAWFGVFFLGQQLYIRLDEEPALRKRFGTDYDRYYDAVPRWIPRWGAWSSGG